MNRSATTSVCIIGAGSMGISVGYLLSLAGAGVTYLVRPHRQQQLARPQVLYSYDDHSLKTYTGYDVLTDPAQLGGTSFDFVLITLDGAALRAEAGQQVVEALGRAFRGTSTAVILGSVGIELRTWFLEQSGLADMQVANSGLTTFVYEVPAVIMPLHPGVKPDLLAQADYAYRHTSPVGLTVDLSAPQAGHDFAALYNRSGVSQCSIISPDEYNILVAIFPIVVAWELLQWPATAEIDPADETWQLGVRAMQEFQRLSIFGPAGLAASKQTDAEGVLGFFRQLEQAALPLNMTAFFGYHHGGKVNSQDHAILRDALRRGEEEGAEMPALRALIALLPPEKGGQV